jgi:restriction system protein
MAEPPIWGIHADRGGEAETLFLNGDVALCWYQTGDLSDLRPNRDAFKARVAEVYPDWSPQLVANIAGQLFRFVNEMQPGDYVAWRSKTDRQIRVGRVSGSYRYDPQERDRCPHQRRVEWLKKVPPSDLSPSARTGVGLRQTLAKISQYLEEWRDFIPTRA